MTKQSWLFLFTFFLSLIFHFSCLFPSCWAYRRLHFGGQSFWESFYIFILGLDERKGRRLVKQGFHGNFRGLLHGFLPCSLVSLTELCSFWYGLKNLLNVHKLEEWSWPLKLMMSQAVEGTWICTGGYGRFRGKWVKWCSYRDTTRIQPLTKEVCIKSGDYRT